LIPACDPLERRELLNGAARHLERAIHPFAEVSVHRHSHALQREGLEHAIPQGHFNGPIITRLSAQPNASFSTVPPIGDVNPYGVAFVPSYFASGGTIHGGDILVSNFNNSANQQGTGNTIVDISPSGTQTVFFQGSGLGLTTALGVLSRGFVLVGNLPTTYDSNGNVVSIGQGSLLILDRSGNEVMNLTDSTLLDGPWDLTVNDHGSQAQVFVSNVLNGTVTRIDLKVPLNGDNIQVKDMVQIGSGFSFATNPAALVVGPTGLAYNPVKDLLYVASTDDNAIYVLPHAAHTQTSQGTGTLVYQDPAHLFGPLGLALTPTGDLLTTNGDAIGNVDPAFPSELIEFTPTGQFVGELSLDPAQGAAFGLAIQVNGDTLTLATVNDDTNMLDERFVSF
jgi:hypothetical protein